MPRWHCLRRARHARIPAHVLPWLLDEDSLTRRIMACCPGRFQVEVLAQGWSRPLPGEARALGFRRFTAALVRQVRLKCGDTPWVYARTVIPRTTLTGRHRRLAHLRNRSLGAVLFSDPGMRRGELELARIAPGDPLHVLAFSHVADSADVLWGRRSVFWLDDKPLLVSEFFLPSIPEFLP